MDYFYYHSMDGNTAFKDIEPFQHEIVEEIRRTSVAGEIYQALKRVNRKNEMTSEFVVCSTYSEAVDEVISQLQGIQFERDTLDISRKGKKEKKGSTEKNKAVQVKEQLLKMQKEGIKEVRKKAIRETTGISDRGNFSKLLKDLNGFLQHNNFISKGQKIILNQ